MNFDDKHILFVDFETYFDRKAEYDLKSVSVTEYIRDPRFKAHCMGYSYGSHMTNCTTDIAGWLQRWGEWDKTVVVAHNVKFDGAILAWKYGIKPYAWFDTVGLAKAVLGEQVSTYHLKGLASYLGLQDKGELSCDGLLTPSPVELASLMEYCMGDVTICRGIYEKLIGQFPQSQLASMDWTIRAFIEPKLVLDIKTLEEGVKNEKERRETLIQKSGVDRSVLSSNKQFAEHLASIGVAVPTKTNKKGKQIPAFAKTDEGLNALRGTHPALYEARLASKANLLETRGESLLAVAKTGAFPFDVGFSGASDDGTVHTHRYSGGSGAGGNPQNFTRGSFLRRSVQPPPGKSLVVGDFSAIELWLLAQLAREPKLINPLINGVRVYSEFASMHYKRPINKKDNPVEDAFGKSSILGLGYNMGAEKFINKVRIDTGMVLDYETSRATVDLYRNTYFNVPRLWDTCQKLIPLIAEGKIGSLFFAPFIKVKKGILVLPSGMEIRYPNLRSRTEYMYGKARTQWVYDVYKTRFETEEVSLYGGKVVENICQALAGVLCTEAIERAEAAGLECVGQVHDEILALHDDGPTGCRILHSSMITAPRWWPNLHIRAEVGYGENWIAAKK